MIYASRYEKSQDTFVKISTDLIEHLLPILTGSELKVLLFMAKWEKKSKLVDVTPSFIAGSGDQIGANLSPRSVKTAIAKLKQLGLIEKAPDRRGYILKTVDTVDFLSSSEVQKLTLKAKGQKLPPAGAKSDPEEGQKLHTKQEGTTYQKKEGKKEAAPPTPTSPPLFVVGAKAAEEREDYYTTQQLSSDLDQEIHEAGLFGNPIIAKRFFQGSLPTSLVPSWAVPGNDDLYARYTLVALTNDMHELQRESKFSVPVLPTTENEVAKFADLVSNFLPRKDWRDRFYSFYRWVLHNKSNYSINLLSHYIGDWQSELKTNRDFFGRSS